MNGLSRRYITIATTIALLFLGVGWGIYALFFGPKVYVVTVLDPSGNPIAGAVVSVGGETYRTGPDGTVELELKGNEQIVVRADGYVDRVMEAKAIKGSIVLEPDVREAEIRVVDDVGRPVEATVIVFAGDGEKVFVGSQVDVNVSLARVENALWLKNGSAKVEARAEGYEKASGTLRFDTPVLTLRLRKHTAPTATVYVGTNPKIDGWAYILKGRQIVGSALIRKGGARIEAVPYGVYTLSIVPRVDGKRYVGVKNTFRIVVDHPVLRKDVNVYLPSKKDGDLAETIIEVRDAETNAFLVGRAFVAETNTSYPFSGTLTLLVEQGQKLTVTISVKGYEAKTVSIEGGERHTVYLQPVEDGGTVRVLVLDIQGMPVEGAVVRLLDLNGNVVLEADDYTDTNGYVTVKDIAPGEYIAEACVSALCGKSVNFSVGAGKTAEVDVTVFPGYGRVVVHVFVDGVPAMGNVEIRRLDTLDVVGEEQAGIDGRAEIEDVPAYVPLSVRVESGGIVWNSARFVLYPREVRTVDVNIQSSAKEGFRVLGVYRGENLTGLVAPGKEYALRVVYACRGGCGERFKITGGAFVEADWPGNYKVDENTLTVNINCEGKLCVGDFSARIRILDGNTGDRVRISWSGGELHVVVAPSGVCSGPLCAYLLVDNRANAYSLYEDKNYSVEIGLFWTERRQEEIAVDGENLELHLNGRDAPLSIGLDGGNLARLKGTMVGQEGAAKIEIRCRHTSCRIDLPLRFLPEPRKEWNMVVNPPVFFRCTMGLNVTLVNDGGTPVEPAEVELEAIGSGRREQRLPIRIDGNGFSVVLNGGGLERVVIRADAFGYPPIEREVPAGELLRVKRAPQGIHIGQSRYGELIGCTIELNVPDTAGIDAKDINVLAVRAFTPGLATEPVKLPERLDRLCKRVKGEYRCVFFRAKAVGRFGMETTGTATIVYAPIGDAFKNCELEANFSFSYIPLPSCLVAQAAWTPDVQPKLRIGVRNMCEKFLFKSLRISVEDTSGVQYNCPDEITDVLQLPPPQGDTRWYTCSVNPPGDCPVYAKPKITVEATYALPTGAERTEKKEIKAEKRLVIDSQALAEFEPVEIDPNKCKTVKITAKPVPEVTVKQNVPYILVGKLHWRGNDQGISYVGTKVQLGDANYEALLFSGDGTLVKKLPPDRPGTYYVYITPNSRWLPDPTRYIQAKSDWYTNFPLSGERKLQIKTWGEYVLGDSEETTLIENLSTNSEVTVKALDVHFDCIQGTFTNNTCGPVKISLTDLVFREHPVLGAKVNFVTVPPKTTVPLDVLGLIYAWLGIRVSQAGYYVDYVEALRELYNTDPSQLHPILLHPEWKDTDLVCEMHLAKILEGFAFPPYPLPRGTFMPNRKVVFKYNGLEIKQSPDDCEDGPCVWADDEGLHFAVKKNGEFCQLYTYGKFSIDMPEDWWDYGLGKEITLGHGGISEILKAWYRGSSPGSSAPANQPYDFLYDRVEERALIKGYVQKVQSMGNARVYGVNPDEIFDDPQRFTDVYQTLGGTLWAYSGYRTNKDLPTKAYILTLSRYYGFISAETIKTLGLLDGVHYTSYPYLDEVLNGERVYGAAYADIQAQFDTSGTPICEGPSKVVAAAYNSSGCTSPKDTGGKTVVLFCLPMCPEVDGKSICVAPHTTIYDPNILNNIAVSEGYHGAVRAPTTEPDKYKECEDGEEHYTVAGPTKNSVRVALEHFVCKDGRWLQDWKVGRAWSWGNGQ